MAKLTCEVCGEKYYKKDAIEAYEDAMDHETPETYDEFYGGRCLCPECAAKEAEEYLGDCLSGYDAAMIYMSSGEDEDYDFSENGIDPSSYKDD